MRVYAFKKPGYLEEEIEIDSWTTPNDFAFGQIRLCDICANKSVLLCCWCKSKRCVVHFFAELHVCDEFIE